MNYRKKVLNELETVLTRDQRIADVHVYTRTTRDGSELYFRRYGTHSEIAKSLIDFDNDVVTELYEIEEILKDSSNVRDMSAATRDRYLQSMMDGTWNCANGDTIVFDKQGNLIDGQHRLSAAYIYQKTQGDSVWFWCADNCETEAALTKDQGLLRSLSALLKRDGVSRASRCSSIVISQLRLQENRRRIGSLKTIKTKAVLSEQYRCWLTTRRTSASAPRSRSVRRTRSSVARPWSG